MNNTVQIPHIANRKPGMLARTSVTNELATAINRLGQIPEQGNVRSNDAAIILTVQITAASTNPGQYLASILGPELDATNTAALTKDMLGKPLSVSSTNTTLVQCVVWYMGDIGTGAWSLPTDGTAIPMRGCVIGTDNNQRAVVLCDSATSSTGCSCQYQGQVCGAIVDLVSGCFYPRAISMS